MQEKKDNINKSSEHVYSPGARRTAVQRKSQNRVIPKKTTAIFTSEERNSSDKAKRPVSKDAVPGSGFRNIKRHKPEYPDYKTKGGAK
jgi:hypothetical protein